MSILRKFEPKAEVIFAQNINSNDLFNWLKKNAGELTVGWDIRDINSNAFTVQFKDENVATMCRLKFG